MAMRSTAAGHPRFTRNQIHTPEPSVALITAAIREDFHPADARALAVVDFMAAAMAVVLVGVDFMAEATVGAADIAKS
jgi:hypothetical protein